MKLTKTTNIRSTTRKYYKKPSIKKLGSVKNLTLDTGSTAGDIGMQQTPC